jgi:parallel beta-helix repeat protein
MPARRVLATVAITTLSIAAVSLGAMIGAASAGADPHSADTYVAPGGTDLSNNCTSFHNPCQTISYALTQTPAGRTINVAAGTYDENLAIGRDVTIRGAGSGQTIIQPSLLPAGDSDTDSTTPQLAIVDITGTTSASLQSLTVDGSAASPLFDSLSLGCSSDYVGIYYHDASGSLQDVDVKNIVLPTDLFGCQDGLGIYVATDSGSDTPSNVTMSDVAVTNYDKNGITCDDIGTFCSISNSQITGIGPTPLIAQNGIQVWGGSADIANNEVIGNNYTNPDFPTYYTASIGVLVIDAAELTVTGNRLSANNTNLDAAEYGTSPSGALAPAPRRWEISNNVASDATTSVPFNYGVGDGIDIDSSSSNVSVTDNTVSNDPEFGIGLFGVSGATISSNIAQGDGYGLYVGGPGSAYLYNLPYYGIPNVPGAQNSTDNSINSNRTTDNTQVGIYADSDTYSNTFHQNDATGNGTTDVVDVSTPGAPPAAPVGTDGTANYWMDTTCATSSPSGLCNTPTPHGSHGPPPGHHNGPGPARGRR